VKQHRSTPYDIKEEQNNNERTTNSNPTMEQLHHEDSMSKHQNHAENQLPIAKMSTQFFKNTFSNSI